MAGEMIRTEAICLDIRPWSRTSHMVAWLTPDGKLTTVVRGAERPKSAFLGQYDLNYTCDILYYARAKGEAHALRECVPVDLRDYLRENYRALTFAGYARKLVADLAPAGPECRAWYRLLADSLTEEVTDVSRLVRLELAVLALAGLCPDFKKFDENSEWMPFYLQNGSFTAGEGRCVRLSRQVAEYLANPQKKVENLKIPLDAARVIGVFYQYHLDSYSDVRRFVLQMISKQ